MSSCSLSRRRQAYLVSKCRLDKCRDVSQIRWKYDASTLSSESVNLMVDKFLQTFLSAKEEEGGLNYKTLKKQNKLVCFQDDESD